MVGLTPNRSTEIDPQDVAAAIGRAFAVTNLSDKSACLTMGVDPAQWSRSLRSGHVSLSRLMLLASECPGFWEVLKPELDVLVNAPPKATPDVLRDACFALGNLVALVAERRSA